MKNMKLLAVLLSAALWTSCDKDDDDYDHNPPPPPAIKSTVVTGAGDLTAALTQFRALLGEPLNTTPNQTGGRREVNWDGVPPNFSNNDAFPLDFFNPTDANAPGGRKRGLQYVSGTKLRVDSTSYSEIEGTYAENFKPFSGKRLISSVNTNITEAVFKISGTNTDASVKGFGAIFSDVDNATYTTIEFFNGSKSLGVFKAPARSDANGFSFLGVFFPEEKITRVKITSGNGILAPGNKDITNGGEKDLVVMDDFFYTEPATSN